uniref:Cullin family profile domain-containing protein n=1 Tax=Plectus sambesii TaxID=2011161 RepID=A0A914X965_9BILA
MAKVGSSINTKLSREDNWKELEQGLREIYVQRTDMGPVRKNHLYYLVREYLNSPNIPSDTVGIELYNRLEDFFKAIVLDVLKEGQGLNGEDVLVYHLNKWGDFQSDSRVVDGICASLDLHLKKYVRDENHDNILNIFALALVTWKEYLFKELYDTITSAVLKLIERDRSWDPVNTRLITSAIKCYIDIDALKGEEGSLAPLGAKVPKLRVYREDFEKLLLEETEAYYTSRANKFMGISTVTGYMYMRQVDLWLIDEGRRSGEIFHQLKNQECMRNACENVLIGNQLLLFQTEFPKLLAADKYRDLSLWYSLYNRVNVGHNLLKTAFVQHLEERFASAMKECNGRTWAAFISETHAHVFHEQLYELDSTQRGLAYTCRKILITKYLNLIMVKFGSMLDGGKDEELEHMYSLIRSLDDDLNILTTVLENHIKEQGAVAIERCGEATIKDPKIYIDTVLEVYCRYCTLVEHSFSNDPCFSRACNKGCSALLNQVFALDLFRIGLRKLMINGQDEVLAQIYSQCNRVDGGLIGLHTALKKHVEEQGASAVDNFRITANNDPKIFVSTILEVHRRYNTLVERSFQNEPGFVQALDEAFAAFINKNSVTNISNSTSKSAELLARYCNLLLTKSAKSFGEAEVEDLLTEVMIVFKYLDDKDEFELFYRSLFAKRLIGSTSASDDAESSMISKLTQMCGSDYTAKLQRMLTDTRSSKELNGAFKEYPSNFGIYLNIDFSIMVLTSGVWPLQQMFTFEIPSELVSCIGRFTDFYNHRHNGRKLTWLLTMSKGELTTNCFQKNYIFTASTVQMALLLMFNESVEYTIGTLVENLKMKKEVLVQVVQALVKIQLLEFFLADSNRKSPSAESLSSVDKDLKGETFDFPDDTIVRLNTLFSNKKLKVDLSKLVLRTVVRQEQEQMHKNIEEDRKILIQAAIVRIMKMRKQLKHQQLMSEVLQQLTSRFQPKVAVIKKCIEFLIEKEYLQRLENESNVYEYLA